MPIMNPSSVAKTTPMAEMVRVFRRPTRKASPYVEPAALNAISEMLMSKPAVLLRNPNPEAIFARWRFSIAFDAAM
jgi:hypothetical protein